MAIFNEVVRDLNDEKDAYFRLYVNTLVIKVLYAKRVPK